MPAFRIQCEIFQISRKLLDRLCRNEAADPFAAKFQVIKFSVGFRRKTRIRADDHLVQPILMDHLFLQWFQSWLLILVSRENIKRKGNPVIIHEQSHANDRKRLVLLALSMTAKVIIFLDLEVVVRAVVIQNVFSSFQNLLAVLVELRLDKVVFLREDR